MITKRRIGVSMVWILGGVIVSAASATVASAANLYATVSQTGALISGSGVASSAQLGPGQYEVTFTADVSGCAYVASAVKTYSGAITAFTAGGHLSTSGVYVETKHQGGGLIDTPFHLVVNCGTKGMSFAVVGYSSDLVRATPGATLTMLGPGRYNVTFLNSVKACAYIATVGDPASGLVFFPNGVYTGSGSTSRTVYVETKNQGGGLSGGIPFHLSVICPTAPKTNVVVVDSAGLPVRGSTLTSSFRSSTGRYALVTRVKINPDCATVGTRGSVDRSVPFTPATIELFAGPAPNTMGLEVRHLSSLGEGLVDQAFHAAAVCK